LRSRTAARYGERFQLPIRLWVNKDHNHDLKGLFKAAATRASVQPGPFQDFYQRSLAKGIKPTMVRLTLARKIAAITLTLWKKGENFDAEKLKSQAA
jgi:transposase